MEEASISRSANEPANKHTTKAATRLTCEAWNERAFKSEGRLSPTLGDALDAGYGYLEVHCNGCKTNQAIALDTISAPKTIPIHELETFMRCEECSEWYRYPYKRNYPVTLRRSVSGEMKMMIADDGEWQYRSSGKAYQKKPVLRRIAEASRLAEDTPTIDLADAEALRLMRAFSKIKDAKARRLFIAMAEAMAQGATIANVEMETK